MEAAATKQATDGGGFSADDCAAMRRALQLAAQAAAGGEVPVGAVVYDSSGIVGEGRNQTVADSDPSAHAEIVALRAAARRRQNYRLGGCKIAVSLEPCLMCAGAIFHARLDAVVYAAADPKTGALGGVAAVQIPPALRGRAKVAGGLFADEAAAMLREFFRARR